MAGHGRPVARHDGLGRLRSASCDLFVLRLLDCLLGDLLQVPRLCLDHLVLLRVLQQRDDIGLLRVDCDYDDPRLAVLQQGASRYEAVVPREDLRAEAST